MVTWQPEKERLGSNAGIAIGPILFIIAILAILAAAIAAGSGSFTTGTGTESNRTKSSALVEIGENLKIGMDRLVMSQGLDPTTVNTMLTATNATSDLFSPTGGGIAPPSIGMANDPAHDKWFFPQGTISGVGSGASNDVLAVLSVSQGVCAEINNRTTGVAVVPASAALGNFMTNTLTGTSWPTVASGASYPTVSATGVNLVGVGAGCVYNSSVTAGTSGASTQYFYYRILAIQ